MSTSRSSEPRIRIAGLFAQFSNLDPAQFGNYQKPVFDLISDALASGGLGLLNNQLTAAGYEQRKQQIDDFLKSGIHQSYPRYVIDPSRATPLTWLRQQLINAARS